MEVDGVRVPKRFFECHSNHDNRVFFGAYSPYGSGAKMVKCGDCGMNLFTDYGKVVFKDGVYTLYLKALKTPEKYGLKLK